MEAVRVITLRASSQPASAPSRLRVSMNTGIKAAESAPSPKRRRNRFGTVNARTKADICRPVPKKPAMSTSRTSPINRLNDVNTAIIPLDLVTLCLGMSLATVSKGPDRHQTWRRNKRRSDTTHRRQLQELSPKKGVAWFARRNLTGRF